MLTVALTHVPLSAPPMPVACWSPCSSLGRVVGVATLGTLYLTLCTDPGCTPRPARIAVTDIALGACALVAAGFALAAHPHRGAPDSV